jgi:uncharacterized repeat protein (TIGR01451 family)
MNARATLVLVLVLSLALVPVIATVPVHAASQYTERLDVYTSGQNAFWSITVNTLATTLPAVTAADATSGVTSLRLVALGAQDAVSDFQAFGVNGYNLLDLPTAPSQGLFLTVNASSSSAASTVVSDFASQFGTSFTLMASSGDSYTYYAPVDFNNVAVPILYGLIPTSLGGFASFATESKLIALPMPFMELTSVSSGAGFSQSVALGAASSDVLTTGNAINLSELVGSTNATISSSNSSVTSQVVIHSLDGVIVSSDSGATVSDHLNNFSGSYSLTASPSKVVKVNASIQSQPPTAVAYRLLDHGTLNVNQSLGVTVRITNTAEAGSIYNVTLNDNWWKSYPTLFQLTSGNYSATIPSIAAGTNMTETYVLKVISSNATQVVIPAATVSYSYKLSTGVYNSQISIGEEVVQLNGVGPALTITATASVKSGSPLGTAADYDVTITNNGNSPALGLKLGNYTISNLAQNGGSQTLVIPIQLASLKQTNFTRTFSLEYSDTTGKTQNITTNTVQLMLSHTSMLIPYIQVSSTDALTTSAIESHTLNVTYSFTNAGKGLPSSVTATQTFPTGLTCKSENGTGTCSGSTYVLSLTTFVAQKDNLNLTFTADNFIIPPTSVVTSYEGLQLKTFGGSYIIPAGITVTKTFTPGTAFPGTDVVATVGLSNVGTVPVFNATAAEIADPFDSISNGSSTKTYAQLAPGANETFSYALVIASNQFGNVTGTPVSVNFLFGGMHEIISLGSGNMVVYQPVKATVTTSPTSPEENHDFTMTVTLANTAAVPVSNVVYTLTLPSGVTVVSGGSVSNHVVTITVPSMQADTNQNVSLTLSTNTGLTIDTTASHLTFQYLGATLKGLPVSSSIVVNVDATTRYTLPIIVAIVIALVAIVFVRRKVGPVAKP